MKKAIYILLISALVLMPFFSLYAEAFCEPAGSVLTAGVANDGQGNWRSWVTAGLVSLAVVIGLLLFLLKRRKLSHYVAILLLLAVSVGAVWGLNIRLAKDAYEGGSIVKENAVGRIFITIRCDEVAQEIEGRNIPSDGVILATVQAEIAEGETVLDLLLQASQCYGITVDVGNGYVKGICGLYELEFGDLSGRSYLVNGETPWVGCGEYVLHDYDAVEFVYKKSLW